MKHAMALLIPFAAFLIGCQENSDMLNGPSDASGSHTALTKPGPSKRIELNLILRSPGEFNSFIEVHGSVEYATTVVLRDPVPPNPEFSILTELMLNAELRPYELPEPVWRVSASTQDDVLPSDQGTFLTRRFWVTGLNKFLCLTFLVTETNVDLNRAWLELPKVVTTEDEN